MPIASAILFPTIITVAAVLVACGLVSGAGVLLEAVPTTTTFTAAPTTAKQVLYKVFSSTNSSCTGTVTNTTPLAVAGQSTCVQDTDPTRYALRYFAEGSFYINGYNNAACSGEGSVTSKSLGACFTDATTNTDASYVDAANPSLQVGSAFQKAAFTTGDCTGTAVFGPLIYNPAACVNGASDSTNWQNLGTYVIKTVYSSNTTCTTATMNLAWITNVCTRVSGSSSYKYVYLDPTTTTAGPTTTAAPRNSASSAVSAFSAIGAAAFITGLMMA